MTEYKEAWIRKLHEIESKDFVWNHHLVFPWKINNELVCVTFVPFETIALCMHEILLRLELCGEIDTKDVVKHLDMVKAVAKQAMDHLRLWENTPKGIRGCGDLFLCKQLLYKNIIAAAHYSCIIAATLEENAQHEHMPVDDTSYHILTTCATSLDDIAPKIVLPSLHKCVLHAQQLANAKKHEWDAKRHHAAKRYGAAFGHVNELNKILSANTEWLSWTNEKMLNNPRAKWTEELRTICRGLRIAETVEPIIHREVAVHEP